MSTNVTISVHVDAETTLERNQPTAMTPGGWVVVSGPKPHGTDVTLFAPHGREEAEAFWRYLANVATDMAAYCRAA